MAGVAECVANLDERLASLEDRVSALERGHASHAASIDVLAEAVTVLQDQVSRKAPAKPKPAK